MSNECDHTENEGAETLFKFNVVPLAGLEPARREARDFESLVSTIPPQRHCRQTICAATYAIGPGTTYRLDIRLLRHVQVPGASSQN
jgi:hypothetical protein